MMADLCDRCGERIYPDNPSHPDRSGARIYINAPLIAGSKNARWWEFHASCVSSMTIADILNGGTA